MKFRGVVLGAWLLVPGLVVAADTSREQIYAQFLPQQNPSGVSLTVGAPFSSAERSAFFKSIGANGRSCFSCHQADQGWTVTPEQIQKRFVLTAGQDPIFRPIDGSNCREVRGTRLQDRAAEYSLLLKKGLIRVDMKIPANADFRLLHKDDPYRCRPRAEISMYRRPLPSTNLPFLTGVMWDGRESPAGRSLRDNLVQQAIDATTGHAEAPSAPSAADVKSIVDFELSLFSTQVFDARVGSLGPQAGLGNSPEHLRATRFQIGINDPLNPAMTFNPASMTLFNPWAQFVADRTQAGTLNSARASIVRGQTLFASARLTAKNMPGLNDVTRVDVMTISCSTCHNTPNIGNHSTPFPVDLGLTGVDRRTPDQPLYTFECSDGRKVQTTDPGRAMVTGKCADLGKFKGPILRDVAARAPYFHNGSAARLEDVVDFYNQRFDANFTAEEKSDLVAFLKAL